MVDMSPIYIPSRYTENPCGEVTCGKFTETSLTDIGISIDFKKIDRQQLRFKTIEELEIEFGKDWLSKLYENVSGSTKRNYLDSKGKSEALKSLKNYLLPFFGKSLSNFSNTAVYIVGVTPTQWLCIYINSNYEGDDDINLIFDFKNTSLLFLLTTSEIHTEHTNVLNDYKDYSDIIKG